MKSVTYLMRPEDVPYGRVGELFLAEEIWLVAVHNVDSLTDGSVVIQAEVAESADRLREVLSTDRDWIYDVQVASGADRPMLQLHFEPGGVHREVLELHRTSAVTLDYPIDVVDHASQTLRVTEVGPEPVLRDLIQETKATLDVTIERIGEYTPVSTSVFDDLTKRQRIVLGTAIELGYYDEPRNVTYEDISRELDCSASAVGQHLRRAEETVMSYVATESDLVDLPETGLA